MYLESVTVIIPAHNRPGKLRRLLHYYSATNIHILVSDSSEVPFPYLDEFPNLVYFHFPKEEFLWKIYKILPHIHTQYVVYCADDDFIVPQAIEQVIAFLDMNPEYISAQGHYLSYETKKNGPEFFPSYIRNFDKDINQNIPSERFAEFRNLYASLLYSVIRAKSFIEMYEKCLDGETMRFSNLFLAEIYFNFFSLMEGKNKTLPLFYGAREKDYNSATYSTVPLKVLQTSPVYVEEYQRFFDLLVLQLTARQSIDIENAKHLISGILQDPKKDHVHPLKRKLLNLLDNRMTRKFFRYKFKMKGLKSTIGMQSYPCTFSTPEKDQIIDHILKFL